MAHKPWRATTAEAALRGAPATAERFRAAAEAELAQARPLPGNAFKVPLARNAIVGTAAAIANAAYHATGIRVRDLPITLDKLGSSRNAPGNPGSYRAAPTPSTGCG